MKNKDLLIKHLDMLFDNEEHALLSKQKLLALIQQIKTASVYTDTDEFPSMFYVLIEQDTKAFYPLPAEKLHEWEMDGSFEKGDSLYKMELIKQY